MFRGNQANRALDQSARDADIGDLLPKSISSKIYKRGNFRRGFVLARTALIPAGYVVQIGQALCDRFEWLAFKLPDILVQKLSTESVSSRTSIPLVREPSSFGDALSGSRERPVM